MADDDDREERDEDEDEDEEEEEEKVEKKAAPKKADAKPATSVAKASAASSTGGDLQSELKKIRVLLEEGRDQQKQYLWLLFPIIAILLVQTILYATKM